MGLSTDHPTFKAMAVVIPSAKGIKAAVLSTSNKRPALEGVDPLLRGKLGDAYTRDNQVTLNAAWLVVQEMRANGFVEGHPAKLRDDCIDGETLVFKLP